MQFYGFLIMGLLFIVCGIGHDWFLNEEAPRYRQWLFLIVYAFTFLFRYVELIRVCFICWDTDDELEYQTVIHTTTVIALTCDSHSYTHKCTIGVIVILVQIRLPS
jgi:hypothetical protein